MLEKGNGMVEFATMQRWGKRLGFCCQMPVWHREFVSVHAESAAGRL
jgi:hypothetical protein